VCCSVLQCVTQCVAVRCSLLQCVGKETEGLRPSGGSQHSQKKVGVLQCVAVRCSVLQCVLQCVAVCVAVCCSVCGSVLEKKRKGED